MKHFIVDYFLYACNWKALLVVVGSPEMTGISVQAAGSRPSSVYASYDASCVAVYSNTHALLSS